MIRVFTAGGLGNRLFQYSFAHVLSLKAHTTVEIVDCVRPGNPPHINLPLNSVVNPCAHVHITQMENPIKLQVFDPWTRRRHHLNIKDSRKTPFWSVNQILDSRELKKKYVGYYQNKDFIYEVEYQLLDDFKHIIAEGNRFRQKYGAYEVIHVRGGDYRNHENANKFGVLSDQYYDKTLRQSKGELRIIITDDIEWANTLLNLKPYAKILGPKDLEPVDCLALMSGSNLLVTANSTFSWWGGFLASSQGGKVIFPEPIFKSPELMSGNAFHFRDFEIANSVFV